MSKQDTSLSTAFAQPNRSMTMNLKTQLRFYLELRGDRVGSISSSDFNKSEHVISGGMVHRVFDNPSNDRCTPGVVIVNDLAWEHSDE